MHRMDVPHNTDAQAYLGRALLLLELMKNEPLALEV